MISYLIAMATIAAIYGLMVLALNIMWGMAGLVNFGIAGFFAVGAYTSALTVLVLGWPIWLGLIAGGAMTAGLAALTCAGLRGLRNDYFAIVTLGFTEVIRLISENEIWLTRGTDGISGIPQPFKRYLGEDFNLFYLGLCLALLGVAFLVAERLRTSPFGRTLRALRDDPQVAAVAGKPVGRFQIKAFALGGAFIGIAGALYAHYTSYISPELFVPLLTLYVFLATTTGGRGNNLGAVVGSFVVIFFLESTRFATEILPFLTPVQVAAGRGILIGLLFLLVLAIRPYGLLREPIPRWPNPKP
jgi:branched-chain amino acid transport system permease protein